jgi:hypothetical protein
MIWILQEQKWVNRRKWSGKLQFQTMNPQIDMQPGNPGMV